MLDADNAQTPGMQGTPGTPDPITPPVMPPPGPEPAAAPAIHASEAGIGASTTAPWPPFPSGVYPAPPFAPGYAGYSGYPGMPQPPFPPPPYAPPPGSYPYASPYPPLPYPPMAMPAPPNSRRRPGYFIAACGSLLALLAFFGFPFYTISASLSSSLGGSASTSLSYSESLTASQLAGMSSGFSLIPTGTGPGLAVGLTPLLWITAIVAGGALLLCVAVPFSMAAFHNGTHVLTGWALLVGGLIAAGLTTVVALLVLDQLNTTFQSLTNDLGTGSSSLGFGISVNLGIGFYALIVALLVVALGGVIVLARRDRRV